MTGPDMPRPSTERSFGPWMAAALIVIPVAALLAYSNSFHAPFIFDDAPVIEENLSIRSLWPPWGVLRPAWGNILAGRPLFNLTLAANFALDGLNATGYHVVNLLIHVAAALLLFGVIRRTLACPVMRRAFGEDAEPLALFCALVWMLHPVHTSAVTYVCGRNESLLGLCFLATLYCAIRAWQSNGSLVWHLLSGLAFTVGAGVKEVIVVAPLVVFFYQRVFIRDSLGQKAKPLRPWLPYAAYIPGLIVTALLLSIGGAAAFVGKPPYSRWEYMLTQPVVIGHYIRLAFWPDALCLDYNWPVASVRQSAWYAGGLSALFLGSAWALWRRHPLGVAGAWFFLILAPSSSIMPLRDLAFEYRVYLSLAALVCLAVLGGYRILKDVTATSKAGWRAARATGAVILVVAVAALGVSTYLRNNDYKSAAAIWADTLYKQPLHARASLNLGTALAKSGEWKKAVACFKRALDLEPGYVAAWYNLGCALAQMGRHQEAVPVYNKVLESSNAQPGDIGAYRDMVRLNLASSLAAMGDVSGALAQCRKLMGSPQYAATALFDMAQILASSGRLEEAAGYYEQLLRIQPDNVLAHVNLGVCLALSGNMAKAMPHYQKAVALEPGNADALQKLSDALASLGRCQEAVPGYQKFLSLKPDNLLAHVNLGVCLARTGRRNEAVEQWRQALRLEPANAGARTYLKILGQE